MPYKYDPPQNTFYFSTPLFTAAATAIAFTLHADAAGGKTVCITGLDVHCNVAETLCRVSVYRGGTVTGGTGTALTATLGDDNDTLPAIACKYYTADPTEASGTDEHIAQKPVAAAGAFGWSPGKWEKGITLIAGSGDVLLIYLTTGGAVHVNGVGVVV